MAGGGGDPSYLKFWVNRPRWSEIADFEQIIARSASAVTPSEKSSINARKSTTRFPDSHRTLSLIPQKGTQNDRFPSKIVLRLKKVCYKVSLRESCQRQSCRAVIGLTIHTKITGGEISFYLKFWVKVTALERNRRYFRFIFARSA